MKHPKLPCPVCGALVQPTHAGKIGIHLIEPKRRCSGSGKRVETGEAK